MKLKPDSVLTTIDHTQTRYPESEKERRDRSGVGDSNWDPSLAGPQLAEKGVAYIEQQSQEQSGKKFYMYYCTQAVHIPHSPPTELDGKKIAGATLGPHGDMIVELNTQVGMLVKALKRTGVYDDTLFIFTSDNGGLIKDKPLVSAGHKSSNGLSGEKGAVTEGGHRVPFIAVWPGKIQPNTVCDVPIVGHDTVATIATLADQNVDRYVILDSTSLLPYFFGTSDRPAHTHLMHRGGKGPSFAIRDGKWKLIRNLEEHGRGKKLQTADADAFPGLIPTALYDLSTNLNEQETLNLVSNPEYVSRTQKMLSTYQRLRQTDEPTAIFGGMM